jgi:DNA-binding Lrp family transcriptional regulator
MSYTKQRGLTLDAVDRQLLDVLQQAFPLVPAPFSALAQQVNLDEDEILARLQRLKEGGIIRQIGPIFDSRRLGYRSTLAAFRVALTRLDRVARRVSDHPGVSHNYARRHRYNLWFTITLPGERDLEGEVRRLAEVSGVDDYLNLPALRTFKIGVRFDLSQDRPRAPMCSRRSISTDPAPLSPFERDVVRVVQGDLPLVERPFRKMALQLVTTEERLLETVQALGRVGVMRRFSAVLHHRRAGFTANGMACWAVPEDRIVEAGEAAVAFHQVSHCYQRPAYPPRWQYTLFTMVHGRRRAEVEEVVGRIHQAVGPVDHVVLYSVKEYKKERVRYFSDTV